ncbi:MAG: hypothetical protein KGK08_02135, partial [Acidobacteriota bacterium]|nr:hypothetical protein [Acidobacteriota bacterium]
MIPHKRLTNIIWISVFTAMLAWLLLFPTGWDFNVIARAIHSEKLNMDPYSVDIARVQSFYMRPIHIAGEDPPFGYVYPPITLLALNRLKHIPPGITASIYLLLCIASITVAPSFLRTVAFEDEITTLQPIIPILLFFPGLIASGTIMGG